ncbi:hypothetical protein QE422_000240 [Chryseobacterium sp. SORGH_AS 447]|uniref:hypothetical protein n=1 Tax=Chryseobacterium sp. SORGH_AS_0447 TaxID=3041769 RepID=UPI0027879B79|nr:hypothetical protein [Chryseobacterium sp. SORGH_AS_0447]MDQ1159872.1 hypothetical protein [Chryseobacterium sp. SORGH_AS_0447]
MKKTLFLAILSICSFSFAQVGNVGINTKTPRVKLDVAGTYKSSKIMTGSNSIPAITSVEKDRYLLLSHSVSDNTVKKINPGQANAPGIASIVTYSFTNVQGDWVENFNTKINSNDYSLMVLSAYFDRDLYGGNIAIPSYGVKSVNNEWQIYADYSQVAPQSNGVWTIVCAVYPKTYVKIFSEHGPFNLNGTTTGSDSVPILP